MIKLYPEKYPGAKAYFSEADPSTQRIYCVGREEVEIKAKLWLLLFDHLIISAGHAVESQYTFDWLVRNSAEIEKLSGENAILLSLRNDCDSMYDFALKHSKDRDEPWRLQISSNMYLERARRLDDLFASAITWSPQAESSWFRDSLVSDLRRPQSQLRKRLVGLSRGDLDIFAAKIEQTEFLTRRKLVSLAQKYCPRRLNVIQRYADIFYHLSGAREKQAYPILYHREAELCRNKISDEISQLHKPTETDLWQEIISSWNLGNSLKASPLTLIREIREDSLGKRVRDTWRSVIQNATMQKPIDDTLCSHLNARKVLIQEFQKELNKQRRRFQDLRFWRSKLEITAWATGGLATILGVAFSAPLVSAVGIATGVLGFLTGSMILDNVEKRIRGLELVLLSARIDSKK